MRVSRSQRLTPFFNFIDEPLAQLGKSRSAGSGHSLVGLVANIRKIRKHPHLQPQQNHFGRAGPFVAPHRGDRRRRPDIFIAPKLPQLFHEVAVLPQVQLVIEPTHRVEMVLPAQNHAGTAVVCVAFMDEIL